MSQAALTTNSSIPTAASNALNYISSIPNPFTSGMKAFPTALNVASLALKNLAYISSSIRLTQGLYKDEPTTPSLANEVTGLLTGIAIDGLHIALYQGETLLDKGSLFVQSVAVDAFRKGSIFVGASYGLMPLNGIFQAIATPFQVALQTETNYLSFNDVPSKEGNLYGAIEGNNPRLVHEWSKSTSFDINKMGEGGPSGTVPALFIAAKVPDVKKEVFTALIRNGADPQCVFVDPEKNYAKFTITEYLENADLKRLDLINVVGDAIRDAAIAKKNESGTSLLIEEKDQLPSDAKPPNAHEGRDVENINSPKITPAPTEEAVQTTESSTSQPKTDVKTSRAPGDGKEGSGSDKEEL